ncbi:MAG: hypothetical protein OEZ01_17210, partial [Candidatus Heimdallarchaeota archaeon]|nr:hypothetical protein [Candidatus Heimdallarchaeota archaeon]
AGAGAGAGSGSGSGSGSDYGSGSGSDYGSDYGSGRALPETPDTSESSYHTADDRSFDGREYDDDGSAFDVIDDGNPFGATSESDRSDLVYEEPSMGAEEQASGDGNSNTEDESAAGSSPRDRDNGDDSR